MTGHVIRRLQKMRKLRGMTQQELSAKTGISIRTIQAYENGDRNFSGAGIDVLLKCAIALHCRLEDIIDNTLYRQLLSEYAEICNTGKWERWVEVKEDESGIEYTPHFRCPKCHRVYDGHSAQFVKYCHTCGLKLDGVTNIDAEACEDAQI